MSSQPKVTAGDMSRLLGGADEEECRWPEELHEAAPIKLHVHDNNGAGKVVIPGLIAAEIPSLCLGEFALNVGKGLTFHCHPGPCSLCANGHCHHGSISIVQPKSGEILIVFEGVAVPRFTFGDQNADVEDAHQ